jgi:hypothetical protein
MKSNERIEQLLSGFMDRCEAEQAAEDIRAGDNLFAQYPAPPVSRQAIERIRCRAAKQTRMHRLLGGLSFAGSAVAAAVVMVVLLHGFQTPPAVLQDQRISLQDQTAGPQSHIAAVTSMEKARTQNLWSRLASHESLIQIDQELTDVADSINAMTSESYGDLVNTLKIDMLELEELELITANTDFWKG